MENKKTNLIIKLIDLFFLQKATNKLGVSMMFIKIILPLIFFVFAILFSYEDIREKKISRVQNIVLLCSMFILSIPLHFNFKFYFYNVICAAFFSFMFFFIVRILTKKKLGFADVLFATSMGILLSIDGFLISVAFACFFVVMTYIGLFIGLKKSPQKLNLPFIPFLSISSAIVYVAKL